MDGVHMKMISHFCSFSCKQCLNHLYLPRSASVMQRSVTIFVCKLIVCLFLQSFEKCLFPSVYRCHMQYILPFWVGDSQAKPFLFQNLSNSCLVFEVGKHKGIAFERIAFIEEQVILEGYLLQVSTHCFYVAFTDHKVEKREIVISDLFVISFSFE